MVDLARSLQNIGLSGARFGLSQIAQLEQLGQAREQFKQTTEANEIKLKSAQIKLKEQEAEEARLDSFIPGSVVDAQLSAAFGVEGAAKLKKQFNLTPNEEGNFKVRDLETTLKSITGTSKSLKAVLDAGSAELNRQFLTASEKLTKLKETKAIDDPAVVKQQEFVTGLGERLRRNTQDASKSIEIMQKAEVAQEESDRKIEEQLTVFRGKQKIKRERRAVGAVVAGINLTDFQNDDGTPNFAKLAAAPLTKKKRSEIKTLLEAAEKQRVTIGKPAISLKDLRSERDRLFRLKSQLTKGRGLDLIQTAILAPLLEKRPGLAASLAQAKTSGSDADRKKLLADVNAALGQVDKDIRGFGKRTARPPVKKFVSAGAVREAFRNETITREEAKKILSEQFPGSAQ